MCNLEAQPKFNCKIAVTCTCKSLGSFHKQLLLIFHNYTINLFCSSAKEMHNKHFNIHLPYKVEAFKSHFFLNSVFFITRNIEVLNRIEIYIIKLGLFEATRVSEQRKM